MQCRHAWVGSRLLVVLAVALSVAGCSTDFYAERYAPRAYGRVYPAVQEVRVVEVRHVDPAVVRGHDFPGSEVIGTAAFELSSAPRRGPERQARRVGADTVIVSRSFAGERRHLRYETVPVTGFRSEHYRDDSGRRRDRTVSYTDYDVVSVTRDVPYDRYEAWFLRTDGARAVAEGVPLDQCVGVEAGTE